MSLAALRSMRQSGRRPGFVWVVLDHEPDIHHDADDAAIVLVQPSDQPRLMDLRPLVGIRVALLHRQAAPDRVLNTIEALQAAGANFFGMADGSETHPCVTEPTDQHHQWLRRSWELLCQ